MNRTVIAAALALLAQCTAPAPALAQAVSFDQAKAAALTASTYLTQAGNPLWTCDPTQPDGFNPTYYDAQNPDVVAAQIDARSHYNRYGSREGRKPCQVQPATNVTRDQAKAGLDTLTAYLAQPQVAAVSAYARDPNRADGFNPIWYNHANPDIAAAGIDPLQHFINNGVWEGRLPYEGAPPFADEPLYWSKAPAPTVVMHDVYAQSGATSVKLPICLTRNGAPAERSYTGGVYLANAPGGGVNTMGAQPLETTVLFLPSNGDCAMFTVPVPTNQVGSFSASFQSFDTPIASGSAHVYVNTPVPAGYVPLVPPAPTAAPVEPVIATWDFQTDFLGSLDDLTKQGFRVGGNGGGVNNMDGAWVTLNTRTVSGATPNPYKIETIEGRPTRVLRPVDQHNDPIVDPSGARRDWAMGGLLLPAGIGPGVQTLRFAMLNMRGGVDGAWWEIGEGEVWPPELDILELIRGGGAMTTHDFQTLAKQSLVLPNVNDGHFHDLTIERTTDFRIHAWLDHVLIVDSPDYLRGFRMNNFFSEEGIGGGAAGDLQGSPDPTNIGFALGHYANKRY